MLGGGEFRVILSGLSAMRALTCTHTCVELPVLSPRGTAGLFRGFWLIRALFDAMFLIGKRAKEKNSENGTQALTVKRHKSGINGDIWVPN